MNKERILEVANALIMHRVSTSLADVEQALERWRSGDYSPTGALGAHGATLRHTACCGRSSRIMAEIIDTRPEGILRDAVDAGILSEAEFVELVGKPSRDAAPSGAMADEVDVSASDKREALTNMLKQGPAVMVYINTRRPGVVIPPQFLPEPRLVLRFGYRLEPEIPDLLIGEDALSGTLSFDGKPFHCTVPWSAIFAVRVDGDQKGMAWVQDIPEDLASMVEEEDLATKIVEPKRRGHLKLVD